MHVPGSMSTQERPKPGPTEPKPPQARPQQRPGEHPRSGESAARGGGGGILRRRGRRRSSHSVDASASVNDEDGAEKDMRIARLEKMLSDQYESHAAALAELAESRAEAESRAARARLEAEELRMENDMLNARLAQLAADLEDGKAMHEYAAMIVEASGGPSGVDSRSVVMLQSKLTKAIHQRAAWGNQLSVLKDSCSKVVKSLQDDVVDAVNEKCQAEMEAMNRVMGAEKEKALVKAECDDRVNCLSVRYEEKLRDSEKTAAQQKEEMDRLRDMLAMERVSRASFAHRARERRSSPPSKDGNDNSENGDECKEKRDGHRITKADQSKVQGDGSPPRLGKGSSNNDGDCDADLRSSLQRQRSGHMLARLRPSFTKNTKSLPSLTSTSEASPAVVAGGGGGGGAVAGLMGGLLDNSFADLGRELKEEHHSNHDSSDKLRMNSSGNVSIRDILGVEDKHEMRAKTA